MNDEEYKLWASKLALLTPDQRNDLARRVRQLWKVDIRPEPIEMEGSSDWLLAGIAQAMRSRGLLSKASMFELTKTKGYKIYQRSRAALYEELKRLLPGLNKAQQLLLAQTIGNALINSCQRFDLPLTPGFILRRAPYALEALEQAYPGYARSGLLHLIIGGFDREESEG